MTPYANRRGDSGVVAYSVFPDAIHVQFRSGDTYRYSHAIPGRTHVATMKRLAKAGSGLSAYIATDVRDRYEAKL